MRTECYGDHFICDECKRETNVIFGYYYRDVLQDKEGNVCYQCASEIITDRIGMNHELGFHSMNGDKG